MIPSLSSLVVGVNVNPITIVTPVTQVNTVATAAVLAGILDNVNLAVNNTAFNFASILDSFSMFLFLKDWLSRYNIAFLIRWWKQAFGGGSTAYPCVRQFDEEDCGAACIATVASFHGCSLKLGNVRDAVGTTSTGTSLLGLRRGAEALGFNARAAKASPELLDDLHSITLPLVCHWDGNHWVVLHHRQGDMLVVADPAVGLVDYPISEFCAIGMTALFSFSNLIRPALVSFPIIRKA